MLAMVIRSTMKPRRFVLIAAGLASSVPLVLKLLEWATGEVAEPKAPPAPPPETWRRLYRENARVARAWGESLGLVSESPVMHELARRGTTQQMMRFPPSREELFDLLAWAAGEVTPAGLSKSIYGPEGQFLIRVWLPCLVLYREAPGRLLRRARAGDDDAFEDLLRLDKSVISDPVLWRRWHAALNDERPARGARFRQAMAGRPRKRVMAKTIRIAFAGLLSQLSKREGCEMTAPEIRAWLVAFARDGLSEREMPGGAALTKAIQRNRNWPLREPPGSDVDNKS